MEPFSFSDILYLDGIENYDIVLLSMNALRGYLDTDRALEVLAKKSFELCSSTYFISSP